MGIFSSKLNITLEIPEQIAYSSNILNGKLKLASEKDQVVTKIKCDFAMITTTASTLSDDVSDIKVLGSFENRDPLSLKGKEEMTIPFNIPIDWTKTQSKGLNKAIMDLAKIAESSQFIVTAQVKVKGSLVPQNIDQVVNIVK
jgi:hypothetical protein